MPLSNTPDDDLGLELGLDLGEPSYVLIDCPCGGTPIAMFQDGSWGHWRPAEARSDVAA